VQEISPESPEARRKRKLRKKARFGKLRGKWKPGQYPFEVVKRVAVGVYSDGFIHAGNLAYLALLTLFPFVIVAAAIARLFGQTEEGLGAVIGLWSTGSFIETIRDIIRRAYGVTFTRPFWEQRLSSAGIIIAAVIVAMMAFSASVLLSGAQEFIISRLPGGQEMVGVVTLLRILPGLMLFLSLYLLFYLLTPKRYRVRGCPRWPGPAFVTGWWLATTALLPVVLRGLGGYDLTYGSLAGVIIGLTFFFVIGLGVVIGAELNAALAEVPEEALKEGEEAFYNRESV
jgi:membrane protein